MLHNSVCTQMCLKNKTQDTTFAEKKVRKEAMMCRVIHKKQNIEL